MTELALKPLDDGHTDLVQSGFSYGNGGSDDLGPQPSGRTTSRFGRAIAIISAIPNLWTYVGIVLTAVGVVLIVVAWGKTAGLTNVALQMPYVMSAGIPGLGLVVIGLTVVNMAAKHADAVQRSRQLSELRGILVELRRVVEEDDQ